MSLNRALAALILAFAAAIGGAIRHAQATPSPPATAAAFEQLRNQDRRVASVAYRLRTSNLDRCPARSLAAGWTLHHLSQYAPRLRADAAAHFGLEPDHPSILATAEGGPADRAGLLADDVLLSIGSARLERSGPPGQTASFGEMEAIEAAVTRALQDGVSVRYQRGGALRETVVNPVPACAYPAGVDPDARLDAASNGERVFITSAMVEFTRTDDELAFILGHEYAHIILDHAPSSLGQPRERSIAEELAADQTALALVTTAGFDVCAAPAVLSRLGRHRPWLFLPQIDYPRQGARLSALRAAVRQIKPCDQDPGGGPRR